jgi:hypothetical protein
MANGEGTSQPVELHLPAPPVFDESIGYWTGEPDDAALSRALVAVPLPPEVEMERVPGGVVLRGPAAAIREFARRLRAAGLG